MEIELRAALRGISAYRNLLDAPLMKTACRLLDALKAGDGQASLEAYATLFYDLRAQGCATLGDWLWDALRFEESPYPRALERGAADKLLEAAARQDVATFARLAALNCAEIVDKIGFLLPEEYAPVLRGLPQWTKGTSFTFGKLKRFYKTEGSGIFARYRAFLWRDGSFLPVTEPDSIAQSDMIGYAWQRSEVLLNTKGLVEGRLVNNVLLYGDSGTGKSATVKSLLAVPGLAGLRLIEVEKSDLNDLPELIRTLGGRRQKFILFVDDLTFDQDDRTYSALKTILEGGLEKRPVNVAIYATSNRRNLVRQTFSDRMGDEVDAVETIQEKTSLAERFGLRIPYLTMSKNEYLDMVEKMAVQHGIALERERLRAEAVKWEIQHHGRTPRVARQFILSLTV